MQKVSYMGDGVTTEFAFNFPYFENSNIIVNKNGATATGYNIVGTSAGLDADIPYTGGKVVFETAPTALDNITIARSLPLSRVVDYQPLAKIDPTTLNQDMNYMMEVLKDLQDELDGLATQYSEIANKESTAVLLAEMAEIHSEIVAVAAQITALGDVSQIRSDITSLKDAANITNTGKTNIVSFGIPDYSNGTDIFNAARSTGYTAPTNGFVSVCQTPASSAYEITIDNNVVSSKTSTQSAYSGCFFGAVAQGSVIKTNMPDTVAGLFLFFPTK